VTTNRPLLPSGFMRACAALAACVCLSVPAARAGEISHKKIDQAVGRAISNLLAQIGGAGAVADEYPAESRFHGGRTALTALALLTAEVDYRTEPRLQKAIEWLVAAKLNGTYAVSLRACALSLVRHEGVMDTLRKDAQRLIRAGAASGAYGYTDSPDQGEYDNSNSQLAVLGVWSASRRGIEVPLSYWKKVEEHWLSQQQPDGGFGYRALPLPARTKTYGSMTAAGVATLFICFDSLHRGDYVRCAGPAEYKPVEDGLAWLARRYSAAENPGNPQAWHHYWLFSLERVALTSGYKYFGGRDWYADGTAELLATQNRDGSWGFAGEQDKTCFALMFLAWGRGPVLVNKLRYAGMWNPRPRDISNLTRWLSWNFERTINWQIIDADSDIADWQDAPILYVSGAGPCEMPDKQIARLRTFALQGGLIVSEAACNSGDFTLDMRKIYARAFPEWPLRQLDEGDGAYRAYFQARGVSGLMGVSNGVRLLAVHSPRELSLALHMAGEGDRPWFELFGNLYMLATDKGNLPPRASVHWPVRTDFKPLATISVARISHSGGCDPEPLAWQRYAVELGNRRKIRLIVSEPMPLAGLDPRKYPVAAMTGTEDFKLSPEESEALENYLRAGGTLVVDAAGGSRRFDKAVWREILPIMGEHAHGLIVSTDPIYQGPEPAEKLTFRRDYADALGALSRQLRLRGVRISERLAVIYSPDDITAALVGYQHYGVNGYTHASAYALMTNIILNAVGLNTPQATTAPATASAPSP